MAELSKVAFQARDEDASLVTLLSDPRALALTKRCGPKSILTRELDGRLARIAINEEIVAMYECYDDTALEPLVTSLAHNTSWPARLLAAMYGASGFAVQQSLIACFESSRTAISFLLNMRPYIMTTAILCRRALRADKACNRWRVSLNRGDFATHVLTSTCPYIAASAIRHYHWRCEITTITTPPMGHLFKLIPEGLTLPGISYIHIRVGKVHEWVGNVSDHLIRGDQEPFLGNVTSSATRNQMQVIRSKDALIDGVLNLAVVKSWAALVDDDGSLDRLVEKIGVNSCIYGSKSWSRHHKM